MILTLITTKSVTTRHLAQLVGERVEVTLYDGISDETQVGMIVAADHQSLDIKNPWGDLVSIPAGHVKAVEVL